MDRREFFKAVGAGGLGLAAAPVLGHVTAPPALAAGELGFFLSNQSRARTPDGGDHRMGVFGSGWVSGSQVWGSGIFQHSNNADPLPRPVLAGGTWAARRLVNWSNAGSWGAFTAGILELEVELGRQVPSSAAIPARLKIVCNLGAVPISTGQHEGFVLSIPGTPFVEGGAAGPFVPLEPEVPGTTVFLTPATLGTFDYAWEQDFQRVHGRIPTIEDRVDRAWSLEFQARTGRAPTDADWLARWRQWH